MDNLFELRNFDFSFGKQVLFKNLNLSIPKTNIVAIMGPSGCGKSSFLSVLNKIFELDSNVNVDGEVIYKDTNILSDKVTGTHIRKEVGMIFQQPTCFPVSIYKNISIVLEESGYRDKKAIENRVEELLRKVHLWGDVKDRLHQLALKLSGGQQQRLCIARSLAADPKVLLMDEPCSALDPVTTSGIEELIKELSETKQIILVTHNIAQARRIADHGILFWNDGQEAGVLASESIKNMLDNPCCETTRKYFSGELG